MAVWNWYMTRALRERVVIVVAIVVVVVLVIGTISSLTDEDDDVDDEGELMNPVIADDDPDEMLPRP